MNYLMNSESIAHHGFLSLTGYSITAFNNLVNLEAKYSAFSKRRIAAITKARMMNAQSLASLHAQIQTHDRAVQVYARHTFAVRPLPGVVRRWL
jgi:hypothetical protein